MLIRKMMNLGRAGKTAPVQFWWGGVCAARRGFAVSTVEAIR